MVRNIVTVSNSLIAVTVDGIGISAADRAGLLAAVRLSEATVADVTARTSIVVLARLWKRVIRLTGDDFRAVLVQFARYATLVDDLIECRLRIPPRTPGSSRACTGTCSGSSATRSTSRSPRRAMNVGGVGEIGFRPHRAQMHPDRIAELEARYPRTDFKPTAIQLARAEARRVRGGRFGVFRWLFPLFLRA